MSTDNGYDVCPECGAVAVHLATSNAHDAYGDCEDENGNESQYGGESVDPDVCLYFHICFECGHLVNVGIESPRDRDVAAIQAARYRALLVEALETIDDDEQAQRESWPREVESGDLVLDLGDRIRAALGIQRDQPETAGGKIIMESDQVNWMVDTIRYGEEGLLDSATGEIDPETLVNLAERHFNCTIDIDLAEQAIALAEQGW